MGILGQIFFWRKGRAELAIIMYHQGSQQRQQQQRGEDEVSVRWVRRRRVEEFQQLLCPTQCVSSQQGIRRRAQQIVKVRMTKLDRPRSGKTYHISLSWRFGSVKGRKRKEEKSRLWHCPVGAGFSQCSGAGLRSDKRRQPSPSTITLNHITYVEHSHGKSLTSFFPS